MRGTSLLAFASLFAGVSIAQRAEVDVHPSAPNTIAEMRIRFTPGRYEVRNATLVDLIRTAWSVDANNVTGGPAWLDQDRFDVIAAAPAGANADTLKSTLQGVLKDRFQLSIHNGQKDEPAYEIVAGKKPALKAADGSEPTGCIAQPRANPTAPVTLICRNMTMEAFAKVLPGIREASGYLFNYPVVDRARLKGAWNFSFTWYPRQTLLQAPVPGEATTIFEAFEKQLGLKLNLTKVSHAVVVVDSVKQPTANPAGTAVPRLEFDVADIKPLDRDAPGPGCGSIAVRPGGLVRVVMTVRGMILEFLGENNTHRIEGGPKSIDGTCWSVTAKAPFQTDAPEGWNGPVWNGLDIDSMRSMVHSLLEDRFKLAAHYEDRTVSGYALVAAKPKLRRADPSNRPGCREGPGADGKDPRLQNPIASRLVTCRNMTVAQFAAELNHMGCGCAPVIDASGIEGRYDITVNFSPQTAFATPPKPETNAADAVAPEPNGAVSIFDALGKLGLKLQSREVPTKVYVVDRVNDAPTEN